MLQILEFEFFFDVKYEYCFYNRIQFLRFIRLDYACIWVIAFDFNVIYNRNMLLISIPLLFHLLIKIQVIWLVLNRFLAVSEMNCCKSYCLNAYLMWNMTNVIYNRNMLLISISLLFSLIHQDTSDLNCFE